MKVPTIDIKPICEHHFHARKLQMAVTATEWSKGGVGHPQHRGHSRPGPRTTSRPSRAHNRPSNCRGIPMVGKPAERHPAASRGQTPTDLRVISADGSNATDNDIADADVDGKPSRSATAGSVLSVRRRDRQPVVRV